jgi:hypothetical protein
VLGVDDGIMRLLVLTDGVMAGVLAAGVFSDDVVPDCTLSLLRERLDDVGDGGTPAEAILSGLNLIRPPLSFALRLKARSLCSLKERLRSLESDSSGCRGGHEGSTTDWRQAGGRLRAGSGVHHVKVIGSSAAICKGYVWATRARLQRFHRCFSRSNRSHKPCAGTAATECTGATLFPGCSSSNTGAPSAVIPATGFNNGTNNGGAACAKDAKDDVLQCREAVMWSAHDRRRW